LAKVKLSWPGLNFVELNEENAMTTANATVTPLLTSAQRAAREFWRQAGADGMPPFYVMSQYYAQLSANSDNLPAVTAALEQLLTGLGYATDVDTVFGELAAGQAEELGYWAGRYCLFDSDGNRFDLVVGRNGATLTVPPALVDMTALPAGADMASVTVLSGGSFSDGTLKLANAQFQVSLRFDLPIRDATIDTGAAAVQSTAPRCTGTFVVVGGGAGDSRPVNGKRGAWTRAGVNQTADGDPAAAWYGQYVLLDVTEVMAVLQAGGADAATASVVQQPEPARIYNDRSFGLTFQWRDRYGGNLMYNNNVLQCADENDDRTRYVMQFVAPQAGAAELNLAVLTAGVVRSYKGYWVGRYPPPSPASQARLAKRPMMAAYGAGSDASAGGYNQAIDVSSLAPDGKTMIKLPYGAVGNTYALTLNLTGCSATDKFSWTVINDPTGRAAIAPNGGANQTVQFSLNSLTDSDVGQQLQVTVQLSKTSAAPPIAYTLLLDITVIQCDAITVEPTVLPPVVVGTTYTQNLAAHGAHGNFAWSVTPSVPPDLTWDASKHQLYGTVTDAAQIGKAFSLVLRLAASDVIMDPLTVSLNITVQSAPAVASDVPPWARIVLFGTAAGLLVMGIIVATIVDRIKRGIADAKTAEAIRTGNTNIENSTDGNPRLISQSIVGAENATLPSVDGKIRNYEMVISRLREDGERVVREYFKAFARLEMLTEYLAHHPSDNPNDPVEDEALNALGYKTYEDIKNDFTAWGDVTVHYLESWHKILGSINQTSTMAASDRKMLDDTSDSEFNDDKLLNAK
jgi:hypothetical protein